MKPELILQEDIIRANIRKMKAKADKAGLVFRPHAKTHQSAEIANWFRDEGVDAITVSSVSMAEYFVQAGWKDITIAFPFNILETNKIKKTPADCNLNICLTDAHTIEELSKTLSRKTGIFIKLDCDYGRSGIDVGDLEQILKTRDEIRKHDNLVFKGILSHFGNTYNAKNRDQISDIFTRSLSKMELAQKSLGEGIISVGDTPSCSILNDFGGAHEIRPGNFVFYDLMQLDLGSCGLENIGMLVSCPVVDIQPERSRIIIYGGAIHFSKEYLEGNNGKKIFGIGTIKSVNQFGDPIPDLLLTGLSQEHGWVDAPADIIKNIRVGDRIGFYPVHSCLAANTFSQYKTTEGKIVEKLSPSLV